MSGNGPPGIYGHIAFAVPTPAVISIPNEHQLNNSTASTVTVSRMDMVVFGGSTNVNMAAAGCQNGLYRFNTVDHTWTKLPESDQYPEVRYGHTAAVVTGPNIFAQAASMNQSVSSGISNIPLIHHTHNSATSMNDSVHTTDFGMDADWVKDFESVAIIFGGSSAEMCSSNIYMLDISVRFHAKHFYHAAHQRVKHINTISSHHLHKKMVSSASLPLVHPRKTFHLTKTTSTGSLEPSLHSRDRNSQPDLYSTLASFGVTNTTAASALSMPGSAHNGYFQGRPFTPGVVVTVPPTATSLHVLAGTASANNDRAAVVSNNASASIAVDLSRNDLTKEEIDSAFVAVRPFSR
jgi:hypothetical protein